MSNKKTTPTQDDVQDICKINIAYIHTLKKTIKQLELLLNIRLRVEFSDSLEVLNELNSKLLHFTEVTTEIDQIYKKISSKYTDISEAVSKAKKYDEIQLRLTEIEQSYRQNNTELISTNRKQEAEIVDLKAKLTDSEQHSSTVVTDLSKLKLQVETLTNDSKLKEQELNRVKMEKDSLKRQLSNLNSLLKQVNEEKEVNSHKMQNILEDKLTLLKEEIKKIKEQYSKKLSEKDLKIEKLERDLQLLQKEVELNQDFTFLQSSLGNSLQKQSVNSHHKNQNQLQQSQQQQNTPQKIIDKESKLQQQQNSSSSASNKKKSSLKKSQNSSNSKKKIQKSASPQQFSPDNDEVSSSDENE